MFINNPAAVLNSASEIRISYRLFFYKINWVLQSVLLGKLQIKIVICILADLLRLKINNKIHITMCVELVS